MISWLILQPAASLSPALTSQCLAESMFYLSKENFQAEICLMWAAEQ